MKLYQLTQAYQNVQDLLTDPEFAENEDILNALDQIEDDLTNKVEQTIFIMRNLEAEIDPIDAEIKRLTAIKKARNNAVERIKTRLKTNMKALGKSKIKCNLFCLSYRENEKGAVKIDEELFAANNTNEEFVTVKISPNKTAIKSALENGAEIIGAKLVDVQVLTIR